MKYSIVGMNHRGTEAVVAALKPGVEVTLVREPLNTYDRNAVAVWIDGVKVGYIPKNQNAPLARLIDSTGKSWTALSPILGLDEIPLKSATVHLALNAKFARSPNSGYPMIEVESQGEKK